MATKNDYKILANQCEIQFKLASKTLSAKSTKLATLSEDNQLRFGFYYYILQNVLGLTDYNEITECITDCDFNAKLFDISDSDEGIDAVYIDEDNKTIHLFNFKYRNQFNPDKEQSINESVISSKFLNILITENNACTGKLKTYADLIINKLSSKTIWTTKFYIVSNENKTIDKYKTPALLNMEKTYDIDVEAIGLKEIKEYMSIRPSEISAKVSLPTESVMSYSDSALSSDVSYIVNMPLADIIRITCANPSLRDEYNIEDETRLATVDMETNVLFDNVRSYILRSKYNANIKQTLKDDYSRFFLYNNGITIVASDISAKAINSSKRWILEIKNFQVLNGGQTLRTIHDFNKENDQHITRLSSSNVLVRILKVTDPNLKNRISEYTNSQNAITTIDLKSMRPEQLQLEAYLKDFGILYIRKSGYNYDDVSKYQYSIDIQVLGQILFARAGFPDKVSNRKREIFNNRYDDLFTNNTNLISKDTVDAITQYCAIRTTYTSTSYDYYEQKAFYIIYLAVNLQRDDYSHLIDEFETFLTANQPTHERLSRTLVRPSFKDALKLHFGIE